MPSRSREHVRPLPGLPGADILVRLELDGRQLVGYAVVLRMFESGVFRPVRLYDYVSPHGEHHMHRYTAGGSKQQPPQVFTYPSIQDGFDEAVRQIRTAGTEMIDSWRRQSA